MRMCGICTRGMRDGESPTHVRVGAEASDEAVKAKLNAGSRELKQGLYSACEECAKVIRPFAAERMTEQLRRAEAIAALTENRPAVHVNPVDPETMPDQFLC